MEYMPGGDLRAYLHKSRKSLEQKYTNKAETRVITQATIIQFALDIANGMAHLAARQVGNYNFTNKYLVYPFEAGLFFYGSIGSV